MKNSFSFLLFFFFSNWVLGQKEEELVETPQDVTAADNIVIAAAATKKCDFTINCKINGIEISFEYKSLGEDCNEASPGQLVFLTQSKRMPLAIKGLSLKKTEDVGNLPLVCEVGGRKYPAIEINEDRIALFMRIDSRPGYDRLGAVIVDTKKHRVIKLESHFGDIKNSNLAILKSQDGVKTRLVKENIKAVKCDCDAAYADDWKEITISDSQIKSKWILPK